MATAAALWAVLQEGWRSGFGADADHLKTPADVNRMAAAGFTMFTIDPSDHVDQHADDYDPQTLSDRFAAVRAVSNDAELLYMHPVKAQSDIRLALETINRTLKRRGIVDYWRTVEFPPQCRPVGDDDFTCDGFTD